MFHNDRSAELFRETPATDRSYPSQAANFHPDFIIWLLAKRKQYISFVDPKGIRNLGLTDPKIWFYQIIKGIQTRLADPSVILNSFIISNTPAHVNATAMGNR